MGRYRRILVAYDGSESGKNALRQAINLARTEQSWIKVVAVVPVYEGDLELIGVSNIKEAINGPGEKLLAEAREIAASEGASVITNLEQGEPYERIVDIAESENCDLIVMGRRGRHSLERTLMGSVTARVIGYTGKDVLVVPKGSVISWDSLLLATDGSFYSAAATGRAVDLAKSYGSTLDVVSVVNVNEEFYAQAPDVVSAMTRKARETLASIQADAESAGVKVETVVKEGEPYVVINEVARDKKTSITIMGSQGRKGVSRLLLGSVTEKVIGFTESPVLVVKPK